MMIRCIPLMEQSVALLKTYRYKSCTSGLDGRTNEAACRLLTRPSVTICSLTFRIPTVVYMRWDSRCHFDPSRGPNGSMKNGKAMLDSNMAVRVFPTDDLPLSLFRGPPDNSENPSLERERGGGRGWRCSDDSSEALSNDNNDIKFPRDI